MAARIVVSDRLRQGVEQNRASRRLDAGIGAEQSAQKRTVKEGEVVKCSGMETLTFLAITAPN